MRKQALLSVSDKVGIVDFARGLVSKGYHILSTGGTAKLLAKEGVEVEEVADYTGFPEMLDGRVKTLNPKIHAGILARRPIPEHMAALKEHGIDPIDIVCVNLYPFEQTIARPDCTLDLAIENIDIGGPTMIRAAAKNYESVAVVVDPADYETVLAELDAYGEVQAATRFALAKKVFAHTARYDGMITNYLTSLDAEDKPQQFPAVFNRQWEKVQDLRYGENPHQQGAFYREVSVAPGLLAGYEQLQGKELSYNNIADSDAAWECVRSFDVPACVIIKHANPCGVAVAATHEEAYAKAFLTDSKSAFGGIIAFNGPVTRSCAERISHQFAEVIIAPEFDEGALELFGQKKNLRLLKIALGSAHNDFEYCLCLDRHRSHFTGSQVSVKDWLYQNFKREDKEYVKREYEIATELGKLMCTIDPAMRQGIVFKVLYYRYYNFDLDQPFQPQYEQNNRHLLADLHRIAREQ